MRRIMITTPIVQLSNKYAKELIDNKVEIGRRDCRYVENLKCLRDKISKQSTVFKIKRDRKTYKYHIKEKEKSKYIEYISEIINRYDKINNLHPKDWDKEIVKFENILSDADLKVIIQFRGEKPMLFYEHIVKAMDYEGIRDEVIMKYMRNPLLNFRTCVYCNAQFAVTSVLESLSFKRKKRKGYMTGKIVYKSPKYGASYDLDHNKPKSKYPFLCTNFFNLQPACPNCNRRKSYDEVDFSVYSWDGELDRPLLFKLDDKDIIKFIMNNNCEKMYPKLHDAVKGAGLAKEFNDKFHIDAIYKELSDEVEELLWRIMIYNDSGREILATQYPQLSIDNFDIERFVYGTFIDHKDAFKRPLTIMKQDIVEQVRLRRDGKEM